MWTVSGRMDHWLQQDVPSLWNESVLFKNCFLSTLQVPRPGPAPEGRKQEWRHLCPELLALWFSNLTYRRSLESLLQVASSPIHPELLTWATMLLTAIPWGFWSSWSKAHPLKINGLELQANTVWRFEGPGSGHWANFGAWAGFLEEVTLERWVIFSQTKEGE